MLCTVFIRIHRKVNHEVLSVSHDPLNSSVNSWDPFKGFSFLCLLFKCKMNILLLPFLLFYNNLSTNFTHKKAFSYCRCIYFAWTLFWVIDFISDHLSFFSSVASMYLKIMKLTWPHFFFLPLHHLNRFLFLPVVLFLVNVTDIHPVTQLSTWKFFWILLLPQIQLVTNSVSFVS